MATLEQKSEAKVKFWTLNPRAFVVEAFGMDGSTPEKTISPQQEEGLENYRRILTAKLKRWRSQPMTEQENEDANKIGLVIHSGHGTGKTAFASWCICHYMTTRPYCKIPCVAPVGPQLKSNLWPEVHLWLRKSSFLSQLIQWQAEKIFFKESGGKEWFAFPRTVNVKATAEEQAETLAGIHADNMLIVVDEGSGVPDPVFRPLEGGLTGPCNFVLMIGNPTQSTGFFIESFTKFRRDWMVCHWNAEESPLVQPAQIERMVRKYGKDSNAYRIRVLGLPPTASDDTLVPWDWVMEATKRDLKTDEAEPLVLGVDVARYGNDKSIILHRRGNTVTTIQEFDQLNTVELSGIILRVISECSPQAVAIDVNGLGAGVYDMVAKTASCLVLPVNVGESADDSERYTRLRDELFWQLRERFQNGVIAIPPDDDLIGEVANIKYKYSRAKSEQLKIESKQEMRDRGQYSPNKADALALSEYATRYTAPVVQRRPRQSWRRASEWVA